MTKRLLNIGGILCVCAALFFFCNRQTQGFRYYSLLSDLPNDTRWEVDPLSQKQMEEIHAKLDQPFTFLNSGGWCYAFLGADGKTILKFYNHEHLSLPHIFKHFSWPKLLFHSPRISPHERYFQEFNFTSCTLVYRHLKELSGLLYVHLNKTEDLHKKVILYDKIGVRHEIDLDRTEFVVQERAELLFDHLEQFHSRNDLSGAKRAINQLLECLLTFSRQGIRDLDQKLYENFGFVDNKAIALDLSSFVFDPEIKRPAVYKKEILFKTQRLGRWIKKHYPELLPHFDEQLNQLIER
ncbi:MAG: hypothetical protein K2P51_00460 [Rhabdochlamydiaceae bacterium]|nr:hypothetical protein [Rhabdochlamydiaceae bacterium]